MSEMTPVILTEVHGSPQSLKVNAAIMSQINSLITDHHYRFIPNPLQYSRHIHAFLHNRMLTKHIKLIQRS
jgi:hypothetical protein